MSVIKYGKKGERRGRRELSSSDDETREKSRENEISPISDFFNLFVHGRKKKEN